jgi:hypothetical protein
MSGFHELTRSGPSVITNREARVAQPHDPPAAILDLQRQAGNRAVSAAVQRMLQGRMIQSIGKSKSRGRRQRGISGGFSRRHWSTEGNSDRLRPENRRLVRVKNGKRGRDLAFPIARLHMGAWSTLGWILTSGTP